MTTTATGGPVDRLRPRWVVAAVCAGFACFGEVAFAAPLQSTTATIRGVVVDPSDAVLPSATITLTSPDTGQSREARSSQNGSFQFIAVTPGQYRLAVGFAGFAPYDRAIELTVDQELVLRIRLPLARQAESVAVIVTEQPLVEPSKTSLGRTITTRDIDDLPIPGRQAGDFARLATLTPGILTAAGATGISTAGQGGSNNAFLVDGLSLDMAGAGGLRGIMPVDAIQEFRVVSNQFSAEYGHASGAVVNVLTRSGTNTPSGRMYYFHRDSAWNATSAPARQVGAKDEERQQKIAGGFWGGPIVRNRAFIFGLAEQDVDSTVYINTSAVVALFRPHDPLTLPVDTHTPRAFGRADFNLTSSNVLTLRYRYNQGTGYNVVREAQSTAERGRDVSARVWEAAALDTHVIGPSAINEVRSQWGRHRFAWNVDRFCVECAALNYPGIKLGKPTNAPSLDVEDRWQVADVLTWLVAGAAGHHTLKLGLDASFIQHEYYLPVNFSGTYNFLEDVPFDPTNSATFPNRFTRSDGNPNLRLHEHIISVFAQDEWKPRNALAINLGIRWDQTEWPGPSSRGDDVAPRLGLSIDPWKTGTTAFRAGFGRYYDERLLMMARDPEDGVVQTVISKPGFQGDAAHADPFGPNPSRSGPAVPLRSVNRYTTTETPYTDQVSVGMQRQVGRNFGLTFDVVRALGHHLPVGRDLNYPDPTTHMRPDPDPALQQIIVTETRAQSWYRGLQVGVQKRPSRGYAYSLAYTWSSSANDTDGALNFPQDQTNLLGDRGPTLNDSRHRLTASSVLDVPFGCRLATLLTARTALPYNITTGKDDNLDGVTPNNDRPIGVGRNSGLGLPLFQADVRLSRTLHVSTRRIELLIEAFNVTNRANWTGYIGNQSSKSFGQPASAGPPREIQLGARFDF